MSGVLGDVPHQKTGATALHVAAAKGYIKVISLLIQAGAQVNTQVLPCNFCSSDLGLGSKNVRNIEDVLKYTVLFYYRYSSV